MAKFGTLGGPSGRKPPSRGPSKRRPPSIAKKTRRGQTEPLDRPAQKTSGRQRADRKQWLKNAVRESTAGKPKRKPPAGVPRRKAKPGRSGKSEKLTPLEQRWRNAGVRVTMSDGKGGKRGPTPAEKRKILRDMRNRKNESKFTKDKRKFIKSQEGKRQGKALDQKRKYLEERKKGKGSSVMPTSKKPRRPDYRYTTADPSRGRKIMEEKRKARGNSTAGKPSKPGVKLSTPWNKGRPNAKPATPKQKAKAKSLTTYGKRPGQRNLPGKSRTANGNRPRTSERRPKTKGSSGNSAGLEQSTRKRWY